MISIHWQQHDLLLTLGIYPLIPISPALIAKLESDPIYNKALSWTLINTVATSDTPYTMLLTNSCKSQYPDDSNQQISSVSIMQLFIYEYMNQQAVRGMNLGQCTDGCVGVWVLANRFGDTLFQHTTVSMWKAMEMNGYKKRHKFNKWMMRMDKDDGWMDKVGIWMNGW